MAARPVRKNPRLPSFRYTNPGMYFVTVCCAGRRPLFRWTTAKQIADQCWRDLLSHLPGTGLDEFVVMPNHVHAIVVLEPPDALRPRHASPLPENAVSSGPIALGTVVASYKSAVTRRLRRLLPSIGTVWQRNYYEHVIRGEEDLDRVRQYIRDNPLRWAEDPYFVP